MFSYRHGFHAGNHADVLKHVVLVQILRALTRKDKPLLFVDTHAGAGAYALETGFAAQSAEFQTGIARLWTREFAPGAIDDYLAQVRAYAGTVTPDAPPSSVPGHYPGSPQLAWQMLRDIDRLRLYEAHPTEIDVLREYFVSAGRRVAVVAGDGFAGVRACLPPPSRRGLVLIDPSYEDKQDYRRVQDAIRDGLQRFATGTYAVWYPRVSRREAQRLPDQLRRLAPGDWLHAWLDVRRASPDGIGLHGSGMFVFNPPWRLDHALDEAMPTLAGLLAQDAHADSGLDFSLS
ncbi:MAG: 23S rRNA (adenine(2030)-N(6))-methyltransferase RlmJ [Burkholderiaceae bacterium]